ncbi:HAD family hydrolase [Paenibacillus sp. 1P07SE]|uniref:HAD family hydrolase n=1 Tax=Paenibacillus sp. 1P07SE TaxID=3132209 RepID=UPI0039A4E473
MIKLLISDLDGTLLHDHSTIHDTDIEALKRAQDSGIAVAFASGRMYPEIQDVARSIGMEVHAVSQNGAYAHLADGTRIKADYFPRELQLDLIRHGRNTPYQMLLCAPEYYVIEEDTEHARRLEPRLKAPLKVIPDLTERLGHDLLSSKMSFFGEVDDLREYLPLIKEKFGDAIDAYIADIDCLDIMPSGISKGIGAQALLQELGLTVGEVVCIGDSFNDLPLFEITPNSYAIAASHPDVQAHAAYTTPSVAAVVEQILSGTIGARA